MLPVLRLLVLTFYLFMGFHSAFDNHVQVLCIEEDGRVSIETHHVLETELVSGLWGQQTECGNCQDFYLGTGHPDDISLRSEVSLASLGTVPQLAEFNPLVLEPLKVAYLPQLSDSSSTLPYLPTPRHIPSTVLLI